MRAKGDPLCPTTAKRRKMKQAQWIRPPCLLKTLLLQQLQDQPSGGSSPASSTPVSRPHQHARGKGAGAGPNLHYSQRGAAAMHAMQRSFMSNNSSTALNASTQWVRPPCLLKTLLSQQLQTRSCTRDQSCKQHSCKPPSPARSQQGCLCRPRPPR